MADQTLDVSRPLPPRADVAVIGGGVHGSSIAYHLARAGVRVVLLEKHGIAAGASGASAGGVRQQGRDPREFALARRASARWLTLEAELDADLHYRRQGHLTLIEREADRPALEASIARQAAAGLDLVLVTGDDLRELAPALAPHVCGGGYSADDGHANPTLTTRAFATAAARHGATICTGVGVAALEATGGWVTGVRTDAGPLAADIVVLAAGAWSAALAASIGLSLPIEPIGLQALTTAPAPHCLDQVLGCVGRRLSLKQLPSGSFLLGGGWPGDFTLAAPRGTNRSEHVRGNVGEAVAVVPAVGAVGIERAWLGIEARAADDVPILGAVPGSDGLVLATGFSGHGFALSPAVGEAIAELIVRGAATVPLDELSLARFGGGMAGPGTAGQSAG